MKGQSSCYGLHGSDNIHDCFRNFRGEVGITSWHKHQSVGHLQRPLP